MNVCFCRQAPCTGFAFHVCLNSCLVKIKGRPTGSSKYTLETVLTIVELAGADLGYQTWSSQRVTYLFNALHNNYLLLW